MTARPTNRTTLPHDQAGHRFTGRSGLDRLTRRTSALFRAEPQRVRIRAVIRHHHTEAAVTGVGFPVPFGIPAFACCVIPSPLRPSALLTVGLPGPSARTSTGLPRSAGMRHDRGGPLLYPGAAVSSRPTAHNQSAPAAFQRPALHPRCHNPSAREVVTRHHQRFTPLTRPIFPLPVAPGRNGNPSAFPRASHPAVTSDARQGGNRSHGH
jgi:hypothetical protein